MALSINVFIAAVGIAMAKNMNGKYSVASGGKQNVPYNDDYASKGHEFFDVYTPEIATHYSQTYWTNLGNVQFPLEIVERFRGKVMAITGYEHDHVMVTPTGHPGERPEKDVSVPFNWVYNHHYVFTVTGTHSEMVEMDVSPSDPMAHGATKMWMPVDKPSATRRMKNANIPTSSWFSEGNGGESRKSYHGYPNGFAQLVDSPNAFHLTPMNIDTRNRDCGVRPEDVTNCTTFIPGPEPKQARYGRGIPKDTDYSGLLECPCTERFGGDPIFYPDAQTKIIDHTYSLKSSGSCSQGGSDIADASSCFAAALTVGIHATHFSNKTVSDPNLPPACAVVTQQDGSAVVYFNTGGKAACTGGSKKVGQVSSSVDVKLGVELDFSGTFSHTPDQACRSDEDDVLQRFDLNKELEGLTAALDSKHRCEKFCLGEGRCWGCSNYCQGGTAYESGTNGIDCAWQAVKSCDEQDRSEASLGGGRSEKQLSGGLAKIRLAGPADVWFGVGFNATQMADMPYALLANASGVIEQKIGTCTDEGKHCPGDQLKNSVTVVSNTVENNVRTIVMTRAVAGATKDHYSFTSQVNTIPLIIAVGKTPIYAYHDRHGTAEISLSTVGTAECICDQGVTGKLCETGGVKCTQFNKNCVNPGPLVEQKNPTCNSMQYAGGLNCCQHGRYLLDEAQAQESMKRELLRYHVKLRFWFQEYKVDSAGKASHADLQRFYYQTEAWSTEYDIPPAFRSPNEPAIPGYPDWPIGQPTPGTSCTGTCPDGPDCECIHTIILAWKVPGIRIIYAGGHCHAPSCFSLNLYINDTNTGEMTLLCEQTPIPGKGNVSVDRFDEKGYIHIPPCLWSDDPSEGLEKSVWLPKGTELVSVTKKRNTHTGHFGEMALWQMRGVTYPNTDTWLI